MADRRPILAVDVDGVLNRLGVEPKDGWIRDWDLGIEYNPRHGAKLAAAAAETGAELVWCTYWENHAPVEIAPLVGLPDMPVVPISPVAQIAASHGGMFQGVAAVKSAALATYAAGRPVVWLDDEPGAGGYLAWLYPAPQLVVQVDDAAGLSDANIEQARAWLARLTEEAAA